MTSAFEWTSNSAIKHQVRISTENVVNDSSGLTNAYDVAAARTALACGPQYVCGYRSLKLRRALRGSSLAPHELHVCLSVRTTRAIPNERGRYHVSSTTSTCYQSLGPDAPHATDEAQSNNGDQGCMTAVDKRDSDILAIH